MKRFYTLLCTSAGLIGNHAFATINYTFTAISGTYTPNSGGTAITQLYAGADAVTSAAYPIGFTFNFDGTAFTEFVVSDNGCLFFGNTVTPADPASGDAIMNNDLSAASSTRPFAAPLWDDLAVWGNVNYLLTGIAPNRVLTVEWSHMDWKFNVASYGGSHDNISFQVKLYEGTDVIEFVYNPEAGQLANCPSIGCGSASIGLAGFTTGDYYSLNNSGTSPLYSKTTNTTNIYTKPAAGQTYRWTPVGATGIPQEEKTVLYNISPNPASDLLQISFKNADNLAIYAEVLDVLGKRVLHQAIPAAARMTKLDIHTLAKGIYQVRVGNSTPIKFVKE